MNDIAKIRENLAKIQELDDKLAQFKKREEVLTSEQPVVHEENIEVQLLLEELQQQQEIALNLAQTNQKLQKRLYQKKTQLEKSKADLDTYVKNQKAQLDKKKKEHEAKQSQEESDALKEEKRLKSSLQILIEKNKKLTLEKECLTAKSAALKKTIIQPKKKSFVNIPQD